MLSQRENFLQTIKPNGKPDRLVNGWRPLQSIGGDPVFQYVRSNRVRGTDSYDRWGTFISFPADQPAAVPIVTKENQVIRDIESWQSFVKVPDLRAHCSGGWETAQQNKAAIDSSEFLSMSILGTGIFEQLHQLMAFEETLMNFLLFPDEMHELIEVIAGYRLEYMKLIVENLHPDCVVSHDDFGSKTSLFMSPAVWREFFKEPYRKLYAYLRSNGVLVIHHSDSFGSPIAGDLADIGVDVWQGVLPNEPIVALTRELGGRMALMGGIDSQIDRADVAEEEIRAEARKACREFGELPHFIPSYTYGGPGTIFPHVGPLLEDEIDRVNLERFGA